MKCLQVSPRQIEEAGSSSKSLKIIRRISVGILVKYLLAVGGSQCFEGETMVKPGGHYLLGEL